MGLRVEVCGGDSYSDEHQAKYKLKQIIRRDMLLGVDFSFKDLAGLLIEQNTPINK